MVKSGTLTLRNTIFANNTGLNLALIDNSAAVEIAQTTFVGNNSGSASLFSVSGAGQVQRCQQPVLGECKCRVQE